MTGPSAVAEQFARNRILRKVTVSLVVGGFVYLITELTGQEAIWNLTMSIFLGGLTLVVQLLMSFENRLAAVEDASTDHMTRLEVMIRSGFARINEVTELFNLVESSPMRTDTITQLVRHATLIDPKSPPLVLRFAESEVSRFSQFLKDISESRTVLYEGEDRDWLLALARNAVATIDATSLATMDGEGGGYLDDGLWTSDFGQRYLEAQREAIQQGVMIRRLFVLVDGLNAISEEEILAVCRPQQAIGIEVRVLDPADVPAAQREALFDFIVFDGAISYETTAAPRLAESTRPTILNTRLELRPERVHGRIRRFEYLWECGRAVTEQGVVPPSLIQ
ncbi:MAG TPA: phosphatidylserine/phosphatidylglycerophosphate/cardiolipin synthase family protein [Natronosporangium sp.]